MSTAQVVSCAGQAAALLARHWRGQRTLYQAHASWHEAARLDGERFAAMVTMFAELRRVGRRTDRLPRAA